MPYDERWLADLLAKGQVRLAGSGVPGDRALHGSDTPGIARPQLSEAVFQAAVIELAKASGWMVWHAYSAKKSAAGYPDLTLARAGCPLICAELKTDTGQLTKAQQAWLAALAGSTGVVSAVWRPSMWEEICRELRG